VFIYKIDNHRKPAIARRQDFVIPQRREARFREGVHVLSAKGAASIAAWGIAPRNSVANGQALKVRFKTVRPDLVDRY
jgi:hypothetical protein